MIALKGHIDAFKHCKFTVLFILIKTDILFDYLEQICLIFYLIVNRAGLPTRDYHTILMESRHMIDQYLRTSIGSKH